MKFSHLRKNGLVALPLMKYIGEVDRESRINVLGHRYMYPV